ncbi:MAG: TetR/AcrR family transcriptional regulator [[Clostridium] innocuum]
MEESVSKRSRIQDAAVALFHEQGVEATSVNEIVRRANVAKGTFYVYYKDKKELISQILTKQHGCLMNDILNHSYEAALTNSTCWKRTFIDELITYYIQHPKLLRTIQKNIASILDTKGTSGYGVYPYRTHAGFSEAAEAGTGNRKESTQSFSDDDGNHRICLLQRYFLRAAGFHRGDSA